MTVGAAAAFRSRRVSLACVRLSKTTAFLKSLVALVWDKSTKFIPFYSNLSANEPRRVGGRMLQVAVFCGLGTDLLDHLMCRKRHVPTPSHAKGMLKAFR